mmetsp:Transcript_34130/g.39375  ORF Transcript_34130/g.39375 Transcript_34130/m.39375 type:complete len:275 (-) Transcript_34130:285-1109(-)
MLLISRCVVDKFPHAHIQSAPLLHLAFFGAVDLLQIGKVVAEPDASLRVVVLVVAHAQPAKLVLAVVSRHVHAPSVLLDRRLALRTELRVDFDPEIGTIRDSVLLALLELIREHLEVVAFDWHVGVLLAVEAKALSSFAEYIDCCELWVVHGSVASWRRTPFDGLVAVDEVVQVELLKHLVVSRTNYIFEHFRRDQLVAFRHRAVCSDSLRSAFHCCFEVTVKTCVSQEVAASRHSDLVFIYNHRITLIKDSCLLWDRTFVRRHSLLLDARSHR